ncbi:MAG: hypothetical protein FRX49_04652 [Trebouxia sp. A1-2]|nr:MAG: hypothetical protein FRX49_04652 [Trebouxia sp. A1-2]
MLWKYYMEFIRGEGLQAVLDGCGVLLPTEPGPNAPFAFLHNGQTEVPEGLIHGEIPFALLAVDCALELSTKEVCDGAVINAEHCAMHAVLWREGFHIGTGLRREGYNTI